MRKLTLLLFWLNAFWPPLATGQSFTLVPLTNEQFILGAIRLAWDSLLVAPFVSPESICYVVSETTVAASWLIEEGVALSLENRRIKLVQSTPPANIDSPPLGSSDPLFLRYRVIDFSFQYPKSWRSGILGPKKLERRIKFELAGRLINSRNNIILWQKRCAVIKQDTLRMSQLALVENRTYPFLSPVVPATRSSLLFEPLLVTFAVAGLVWLLFTGR